LYCEFWQQKLDGKRDIEFPKKLCRPIAELLNDFSFAYMQEAFVATLLILARGSESEAESLGWNDDGGDPTRFKFYRTMKEQVKILREDMGKSSPYRLRTASPSSINEKQLHRDAIVENAEGPTSELRNLPIRHHLLTPGSGVGDVQPLRRFFSVQE
jgi:hypothetical protein